MMDTQTSQNINTIQQNSFVTLHYSITAITMLNNEKIEHLIANTFGGTPATITIGYGNIPSTLEKFLVGKSENAEIEENIQNAFGEYNPELQQIISKTLLQEQSAEQDFMQGDVVSFNTSKGQLAGTFIQINENGSAIFDFNHPLSGKNIIFKAKIIGIL